MARRDLDGREYATLDGLRAGDAVQVDGDFTCIDPWSVRTVEADAHGKFIRCACGCHYLDGQLGDDGTDDSLIGVYRAQAA